MDRLAAEKAERDAAAKLRWEKEQKERDRLRAERRKTWPDNTVGEIEAGVLACLSHKGAYRANPSKYSFPSFAMEDIIQ